MKKSKLIKAAGLILMSASLLTAAVLALIGAIAVNKIDGVYSLSGTYRFVRTTEAGEEDYSDETVCPVVFETEDGQYRCTVNYTFDEWEALESGAEINGYVYTSDSGRYVAFDKEASGEMISAAVRDMNADRESALFNAALAIALLEVGFAVVTFRADSFSAYEKIWFMSILILASVISIIFPEEGANGINGIVIMALYLADTFLNILCELLISKQSKWNFIVSVFVEITEIVMCIVLAYRFATLATTLFFWLPIDIISFINWNKHPDRDDSEITKVRTLRGWQEALVIAAIALWTVGIGYFLTTLDIGGDFIKNQTIETAICYLDACVSAVGIANGLFILFRYREQWIAWYISAILEAVINILSGQFVLLVLKLGYLTNTTYGFIKWSSYIRAHKGEKEKSIL